MVLEEKKVIKTKDALYAYIESLPTKTQLRFASKTSSSKEYGVCDIPWDEDQDIVAIIPYIHTKSYKREQKPQNETPEILARICLLSETGLDINEVGPKQIGSIFWDNDSDLLSSEKKFPKYTMLITSFKGVLRTISEVISEKNLEPVWIKRDLLKYIFEATFTSEKGIVHGHPQLYAYERFVEYYKQTYRW